MPGRTPNENVRALAVQAAAVVPAGNGVDAGCYSTAANRDVCINLVNEMRRVLIDKGIISGSVSAAAFPRGRLHEHIRQGSAQVVAPAGGTGAAAGCWDNNAQRNVMIDLVNEMRRALIDKGFMSGSASVAGLPVGKRSENVRALAVQAAAAVPAGAGTTLIGWETEGNRNSAIDLINDMRRVIIDAGWMTGAA